MLTGRRVKAAEAERIGFVTKVVPVDELDAATEELASELASKSPAIVKLGRDSFYAVWDMSAADGMVAGIGDIEGGRVAIMAYDVTVMGGSMGAVGERKTARMRELALRWRIPVVWLLDSAGARIQQAAGSTFAGAGALFREQVTLSGVVPQVAAMLGHCAAGTAYIPALADFVPMVKGTSSMALGGRHLVKAATGEDVTEEEMGGSAVHTKISGVADLEVDSDAE